MPVRIFLSQAGTYPVAWYPVGVLIGVLSERGMWCVVCDPRAETVGLKDLPSDRDWLGLGTALFATQTQRCVVGLQYGNRVGAAFGVGLREARLCLLFVTEAGRFCSKLLCHELDLKDFELV